LGFAEEVTKLKQQPGRDILIFGSGDLVNALMSLELVDEYRLMVFPVIAGNEKRLFGDVADQKALKLVDTKTFSTGVVILTYEQAQS
jgi:dihydrofolate reductase